jgi:outer membrane biosynthesis protein TonB
MHFSSLLLVFLGASSTYAISNPIALIERAPPSAPAAPAAPRPASPPPSAPKPPPNTNPSRPKPDDPNEPDSPDTPDAPDDGSATTTRIRTSTTTASTSASTSALVSFTSQTSSRTTSQGVTSTFGGSIASETGAGSRVLVDSGFMVSFVRIEHATEILMQKRLLLQ